MLRTGCLTKEFPEGIDWFTVDGDPNYSGCLTELVSVLPHMNKGGIIYIVADRDKRKNVNVRDACDFFGQIFANLLTKVLDDVVGREICHFIMK